MTLWPDDKTCEFQQRLLAWYELHKRELPWRSRPTPYRIWVSEIMLQQTQVRTVLPFYERFLARFPDIRTLAHAPEAEVLKYWAGLGYYSRARNLHRAAKEICRHHEGHFPRRMDEMLQLPGIGRYTAGAICSIAFNQPQPVVDGNVRRVITRLRGIEALRVPESLYWEQAVSWIPTSRPADFNQAIMELGALICLPMLPKCRMCPVKSFCTARAKGMQNRLPAHGSGRSSERIRLVILVLRRRDRILITRTREALFIPGQWGLPLKQIKAAAPASVAAGELARRLLGTSPILRECGAIRHGITHRRIFVHVFQAQLHRAAQTVSRGSRHRWIGILELDTFVTSSLFGKCFRLAVTDRPLSESRRGF